MKKYIVSFPHIGNYYIPMYNLFYSIFDKNTTEIMIPKKNSKQSLEIGSINSPEFICTPFKYNMGNYIESLENGANVLIQVGGGCRYGYYSEVQEQILKDMGYNFTYITLSDANGIDVIKIYKKLRILNPKIKIGKVISRVLLTIDMIDYLDEIERYIRENIIYEVDKGTFKKIHKNFLNDMKKLKDRSEFKKFKKYYNDKIYNVKLDTNKEVLKIGIVGELYSLMEPFASFFIEERLTKLNAKLKRYTTVTYLLFQKGKSEKKILDKAQSYLDYTLGADGAESVAHSIELAKDGYDGIIHLKPFGCTPEINAMPILQKVSKDYDIPIMYLTFDSQTSAEGVITRLEAFCDMLEMKKNKKSVRGSEAV